ncbi:MAG: asparagine synthetase B, partial [Clostridia bacterium]|nr:asparagine synthetase B [Clostridia bacterium]
MCGIMGYCGKYELSAFEKGFGKTLSRGPDMSKTVKVGDGVFGFHRLSIMGLTKDGMQPFGLDGNYAVMNGEIYGFQKLKDDLVKKGYIFKSDSDCEILLP